MAATKQRKCRNCGKVERQHCKECNACPTEHAYYCSYAILSSDIIDQMIASGKLVESYRVV